MKNQIFKSSKQSVRADSLKHSDKLSRVESWFTRRGNPSNFPCNLLFPPQQSSELKLNSLALPRGVANDHLKAGTGEP